jgi:5-methylcytosine-specific restriction endonuclease McrA
MPIRPENKARYPRDWYQISLRIRERARWKCEWCGVPDGELGGRRSDGHWLKAQPLGNGGHGPSGLEWPKEGEWAWCGNGETEGCANLRIVRIVLTVAHLDHTPENCADENLKSLCQRCHNKYDAPHRRAGIIERARAALGITDLFEPTSQGSPEKLEI